jgi:hypothetical protein
MASFIRLIIVPSSSTGTPLHPAHFFCDFPLLSLSHALTSINASFPVLNLAPVLPQPFQRYVHAYFLIPDPSRYTAWLFPIRVFLPSGRIHRHSSSVQILHGPENLPPHPGHFHRSLTTQPTYASVPIPLLFPSIEEESSNQIFLLDDLILSIHELPAPIASSHPLATQPFAHDISVISISNNPEDEEDRPYSPLPGILHRLSSLDAPSMPYPPPSTTYTFRLFGQRSNLQSNEARSPLARPYLDSSSVSIVDSETLSHSFITSTTSLMSLSTLLPPDSPPSVPISPRFGSPALPVPPPPFSNSPYFEHTTQILSLASAQTTQPMITILRSTLAPSQELADSVITQEMIAYAHTAHHDLFPFLNSEELPLAWDFLSHSLALRTTSLSIANQSRIVSLIDPNVIPESVLQIFRPLYVFIHAVVNIHLPHQLDLALASNLHLCDLGLLCPLNALIVLQDHFNVFEYLIAFTWILPIVNDLRANDASPHPSPGPSSNEPLSPQPSITIAHLEPSPSPTLISTSPPPEPSSTPQATAAVSRHFSLGLIDIVFTRQVDPEIRQLRLLLSVQFPLEPRIPTDPFDLFCTIICLVIALLTGYFMPSL